MGKGRGKCVNDISYDDLCNLIANEVGSGASVKSVSRYLTAIYKVILKELELNKRISFKGFGIFEIRERKSGKRNIQIVNTDEITEVDVKPRLKIRFKPSMLFDCAINENNFKIATNRQYYRHKGKDAYNKKFKTKLKTKEEKERNLEFVINSSKNYQRTHKKAEDRYVAKLKAIENGTYVEKENIDTTYDF